jgi:hypothetical protein
MKIIPGELVSFENIERWSYLIPLMPGLEVNTLENEALYNSKNGTYVYLREPL